MTTTNANHLDLTDEQIIKHCAQASAEMLLTGNPYGNRVVQLSPQVAIKHGSGVTLTEALNQAKAGESLDPAIVRVPLQRSLQYIASVELIFFIKVDETRRKIVPNMGTVKVVEMRPREVRLLGLSDLQAILASRPLPVSRYLLAPRHLLASRHLPASRALYQPRALQVPEILGGHLTSDIQEALRIDYIYSIEYEDRCKDNPHNSLPAC